MTDMQITKVWIRGEMPKGCANCHISSMAISFWCKVMNKKIPFINISSRPSWCPLELEPSIHEYTVDEMMDDLDLYDAMEGEE